VADQKPKKSTGMLIDGVFASEAIDSSGEIVSIEGMDVTTIEEGWGVANYEHLDEKGGYGREIVGKIVSVKKIFTEGDCENDRQKEYFNKIKKIPYLYGIVRLYDGAGHEGAKALAAQIRDAVANDEEIIVRYSIEGSTTKKTDNRIEESIAKKVAMTLRPCNKTAISGLMDDPNAPDGFDTVHKAERQFIDPEFSPLGASVAMACNPCMDRQAEAQMRLLGSFAKLKALAKTTTAGNYDVAPSALTGGAALQVEDLGRTVRNTAKAVLRDYGWGTFDRDKFKKFAKSKLPEMSDDFINHFTDVASDFAIRKAIQKGELSRTFEPLQKKLATEPKGGEAAAAPVVGTIRGKKIRPNVGMVGSSFDSKKGVLHTAIGSFKAYLPHNDGPDSAENYNNILKSPKVEDALDHAMSNWSKVHRLNKAGKLPPEVLMHAVMFSQLSPNRAVPVQEIQFARMVDAMKASGLDPRKKGFEAILPKMRELDHPTNAPDTGREAIESNLAYYIGGKKGVEYGTSGEKLGLRSKTNRYPGELHSVESLIGTSISNMSKYHGLHDGLVDILHRHRTDSVGAVGELLENKRLSRNWLMTNKKNGGDPSVNPHSSVPGLAAKTGLYTWGMIGGGNSVVPDTHFIRNMFGLDVTKDAKTLFYLKSNILQSDGIKPLTEYNHWFAKNHPSVQYTLNHPKWGSTFEKPEDAIFPAFWRHWLAIAPHEKSLGMRSYSNQQGTNHAPFWEAIAPHVDPLLKATGQGDSSIPFRTAILHQQYVKDYGEVPGMFLYYHHIVPKLLEAAKVRERIGDDLKFLAKASKIEAGLVNLRKAISDAIEPWQPPQVHNVEISIKGRNHPAGRYLVHNGRLHHLEDYHGILSSFLPEGDLDVEAVSRLNGLQWSSKLHTTPHYPVIAPPPQAGQAQAQAPSYRVSSLSAQEPRPPSVFEYHRVGMSQPHIVEVGGGGASLDGRKISDPELQLILRNAENGIAKIKYKQSPAGLKKADDETPVMSPDEVMQHIQEAVAQGHVSADVERAYRQHIYGDAMVSGVGNKYAYTQFRNQNKPGVWLSMDANSFKHVNDSHGHEAGDHAIKAVGGAIKNAAAVVGTGKVFRPGGDEFAAYFPSHEEASRFMRHATTHLDAVPPVAGTHKLSMSFGVGADFPTADKALLLAKEQKKDPLSGRLMYHPTNTPHLAHSLMPGNEGPVGLHSKAPHPATIPTGAGAGAGAGAPPTNP